MGLGPEGDRTAGDPLQITEEAIHRCIVDASVAHRKTVSAQLGRLTFDEGAILFGVVAGEIAQGLERRAVLR